MTTRGAMGNLDREGLRRAQQETECTARRRYGLPARVLFRLLDVFYGRPRTLSKFKVLELIARVPYQSWEQVAYIAITHTYERAGLARRIYDRVQESRAQQDNEQWHLLLLEERIARQGIREGWLRFPEWETEPFDSDFAADYAELDTVADLFRQIGYDERLHKQESVARMGEPRFH